MSNKDSILKKMCPIAKKAITTIHEHNIPWFFTGSRCWGVATPDSDFDLCVRFCDSDAVVDKIRRVIQSEYELEKGIIDDILAEIKSMDTAHKVMGEFERSAYGAGMKVTVGEDIINLVRLTDADFLFWMYATDYMNKVSAHNNQILSVRTIRHGLFEHLRAIGKQIITYEGVESDSDKLIKLISGLGM